MVVAESSSFMRTFRLHVNVEYYLVESLNVYAVFFNACYVIS